VSRGRVDCICGVELINRGKKEGKYTLRSRYAHLYVYIVLYVRTAIVYASIYIISGVYAVCMSVHVCVYTAQTEEKICFVCFDKSSLR